MLHHWNEAPHRLGLFGVNGEVRPPYFVYQMLAQLGETQVAASTDDIAVRVLAGQDEHGLSAMLVHHSLDAEAAQVATGNRVATCCFSNLEAGMKQLIVYRVDHQQRWDADRLELVPVEQRRTYTQHTYQCQIGLPANSVALVKLTSPD